MLLRLPRNCFNIGDLQLLLNKNINYTCYEISNELRKCCKQDPAKQFIIFLFDIPKAYS